MVNKTWWLAIVVGLLVGAIVAGFFVPVTMSKSYFCPYCRARMSKPQFFYVIPLTPKIWENKVTHYYKSQVEPGHKHTWVYDFVNERFAIGWRHGDVEPYMGTLILEPEAEIEILESLTTPADRKKLIEKLGRIGLPEDYNAESNMKYNKIVVLNNIYAQSAHPRKDWPQILKKMGLMP